METVLYEYEHNLITIISSSFVPVVVALGFLGYAIGHTFLRKIQELGKIEFHEIVFIILGFLIGPIILLSEIGIILDDYNESLKYEEMLANNKLQVVEGYVEKYHPMPAGGHDSEHFEINGVYFEYSNFEVDLGYNDAASHGGVVTENGQHLRIKYIAEDSPMNPDSDMDEDYPENVVLNENGELVWRDNVILYIAEIK